MSAVKALPTKTKPFAGLIEIAHATPSRRQSADDLAPLIGKDARWITERAGVRNRFICNRYDDPAVLVSTIARPMIDKCGPPDLIIHASSLPRQLIPDTSVFVAREIGLAGVPAFSINASCLSFVVAMQTAKSMIEAQQYNQILISSCEFPSLSRNFAEPESAALFGDAAAVAILKRNEGIRLDRFCLETYPQAAELAEYRGGGALKMPSDPQTTDADHLFQMHGGALIRFTLPRLRRFIRNYLDAIELDIDDIDVVVPHQASRSGMLALPRLGFKQSSIIDVLSEFGNCVSTSIPLALSVAKQTERIKPGNRVLLIGTAAGVSIGAGLLSW